MLPYYEVGDRVKVASRDEVENVLQHVFLDLRGRNKIVDDISGTTGEVVGVVPGEGHLQVLYRPDGKMHSWKVPCRILTSETSE